MTRFRKKPVEIDAIELTHENAGEVVGWINDQGGDAAIRGGPGGGSRGGKVYIKTLEGTMCASPGDYVIRGVEGEFYPCKPGIFAATYDPVEKAA